MKKKLIALFFGANALALGGDATIDNIPKIEAKDIPIAEEVVKIKEVNNVVEAEFSWKDATPIKVSYDLGEPTLAEKVKDSRDTSIITETVTDFDGGFKIDILLEKNPPSNVFCYSIQGAENYDFFYQPPLTAEEIAEGASRPPEIEGSYAVYHKTLKNHQLGKENYATGKVMHIPRPQVWSLLDVDKKVWADMTYNNGSLCVTVPQDFLDKAKYPVRVDPTFGYTSIGATLHSSCCSSDIVGSNSTAPDNAYIYGFTFYGRTSAGTNNVKSLLVASSTKTIVTNGIGIPKNTTTSLRWWTSPFATSSKPQTTASSEYVLSIIADGTAFQSYYDSGGNNWNDTTNNYTTTTNPTDGSDLNRNYSIFASYLVPLGLSCAGDVCTHTFNIATSSTQWEVPTGVTSANVACWGPGGGGGIAAGSGGGGGGGGAFASATISVSAGEIYPIVIAAGGFPDTSGITGTTTFATTSVYALGGMGVSNSTTGGAGGSTANSSGTVEYAGGSGSNGNTTGDIGGGGGGGGGPSGAGITPSNATGGVGADGGGGNNGNGGTGGTGDSNASSTPGGGDGGTHTLGGGGGGGGDDDDIGGNGGSPGGGGGGGDRGAGFGADGQCSITYSTATPGGGESVPLPNIFWFD